MKYSELVMALDRAPDASPATMDEAIATALGSGVVMAKSGPAWVQTGRRKPATVHASVTGSKLRGRSPNSSSSTANSTAASGVPNTAVMPAQAPATSSALRSAEVRLKLCANKEAAAPPVMMLGPSAPNAPPLPITMPADSGFESLGTAGDPPPLPDKPRAQAGQQANEGRSLDHPFPQMILGR